MRLIDADELKKDFDNLHLFKLWVREEIKAHIDNAPTVEVDKEFIDKIRATGNFKNGYQLAKNYYKRPQGEWKIIRHDDHYLMGIYQCNLCSYKYACPDEFARNYCPNCGADMRTKGDKK